MRSPHVGWWLCVRFVIAASLLDLLAILAAGQPPVASETDEEAARQQQIVARFLTVLERNPRRGTALDKVYGFHIENGSVEEFVKQLRTRTVDKPDEGTGWMILGLVESQRGRDAAAVGALTKAKEVRGARPLAPHFLGQAP